MTYLEKYKLEHPGLSDKQCQDVMINTCPHNENGLGIQCPRDLCGPFCVMPNEQRCPICWNREIPGTEPTNNTTNEREDGNMSKKFTKKDLKVGYVVKVKKNNELRMVMETRSDGIVLVNKDGWYLCLTGCSNDLRWTGTRDCDWTIMEVYGYRNRGADACEISTTNRELLWKREPEKTCDNCAHKVVCTHVGMCEHYMEKEASK